MKLPFGDHIHVVHDIFNRRVDLLVFKNQFRIDLDIALFQKVLKRVHALGNIPYGKNTDTGNGRRPQTAINIFFQIFYEIVYTVVFHIKNIAPKISNYNEYCILSSCS